VAAAAIALVAAAVASCWLQVATVAGWRDRQQKKVSKPLRGWPSSKFNG